MIKLKILRLLFCILFGFANVASAFDSTTLLPSDQAFRFNYTGKKANLAMFTWDIAPGYYLYRQKFKVVSLSPGITVEKLVFPTSLTHHDEFFGDVETFRGHLEVEAVLQHQGQTPTSASFEVTSQGCSDAGICYMPVHKTVSVALPPGIGDESAGQQVHTEKPTAFISEQDRIADSLKNRSVWFTALGFLGFGLLLAFTPCILAPFISVQK